MSKENPLTPEEIEAIADAVAKKIAYSPEKVWPSEPHRPHPGYYGPYWIDPRAWPYRPPSPHWYATTTATTAATGATEYITYNDSEPE